MREVRPRIRKGRRGNDDGKGSEGEEEGLRNAEGVRTGKEYWRGK